MCLNQDFRPPPDQVEGWQFAGMTQVGRSIHFAPSFDCHPRERRMIVHALRIC